MYWCSDHQRHETKPHVAFESRLNELDILREENGHLLADNETLKELHRAQAERIASELAQNQQYRAALYRDKTGLANALAAVVKAARGRTWLLEGRGLYEWDDDEYRKEAGYALEEIIEIATKALVASGTLAGEALAER